MISLSNRNITCGGTARTFIECRKKSWRHWKTREDTGRVSNYFHISVSVTFPRNSLWFPFSVDEEFKCDTDYCHYSTSQKGNLIRHMLTVHGEELTCMECGVSSNSWREQREHKKTHLPEKKRGRCAVKCASEGCGETFTTREKLIKHCKLEHDSEGFDIHIRSFVNEEDFEVDTFFLSFRMF